MPDIDLGPNSYRKQDGRSGRWHVPDDPKLCRNMFLVCAGILVYIFSVRDQLESWTLFAIVAMFAWSAGIMFHAWLKDWY